MSPEIQDIPFGKLLKRPTGRPIMLQQRYEADCGCQILSGFLIDEDLMTEPLDELAREKYSIGALACEQHAAECEMWLSLFKSSVASSPEDRPAMEVAVELLQLVLA